MKIALKSTLIQPKSLLYKTMLTVAPATLLAAMITLGLQSNLTRQESIIFSCLTLAFTLASYQVFTSVRPLLQTVSLYDDHFEVIGAFTWRKTKFNYTDIDGFRKQLVPSGNKAHTAILIQSKGKKVMEISSAFTSNVNELEKFLQTKTTFLGKEPYNLLKVLWDRMLWR